LLRRRVASTGPDRERSYTRGSRTARTRGVSRAQRRLPPPRRPDPGDVPALRQEVLSVEISYEWRGAFDNAELNALHAEAVDHRPLEDDGQGAQRSNNPR